MYYKLNSITNRIAVATQMQAYVPQGLLPLSKVQHVPVTMTYQPTQTVQLEGRDTQRAGISGATAEIPLAGSTRTPVTGIPVDTKFGVMSPKLKDLQMKFQKEDNVPIHLKGGPVDVILYRTTMALCIIGSLWAIGEFTMMAQK